MKRTPVQRREASPRSTVTEIVRLDSPKDFERVRFVLKAVLKDPARPFTTVVHVEKTAEGSRLAATDGKRLHMAEIKAVVKSGEYKPTLTRDAVSFGKPLPGIQFPDWKKVVPEKARKKGVINLACSGMGKNPKEAENLSLAYYELLKQTKEVFNIRYLGDLIPKEWEVYCQGEKRKPVMFKEKGQKAEMLAVIMPVAA